MLPFEFTILGPPVSHQTRNRARLQQWKSTVNSRAATLWPHTSTYPDIVSVIITYYYEGESPDVDNIIKPIQDALEGIVYDNDQQVVEIKSRKKDITGAYRIKGRSPILLQAFSVGSSFLHIEITEAPDRKEL